MTATPLTPAALTALRAKFEAYSAGGWPPKCGHCGGSGRVPSNWSTIGDPCFACDGRGRPMIPEDFGRGGAGIERESSMKTIGALLATIEEITRERDAARAEIAKGVRLAGAMIQMPTPRRAQEFDTWLHRNRPPEAKENT